MEKEGKGYGRLSSQEKAFSVPWYMRLVGLVLFGVILVKIEAREIPLILSNAELGLIPFAVVVIYLVLFIKALRWISLFRHQGLRLATTAAFKAYFYSIFMGVITVGHFGDFMKTYLLKKSSERVEEPSGSVTLGESGVSVLIERFMELGLYLSGGAIGILLLEGGLGSEPAYYTFIMLAVIYLLVLYALIFQHRRLSQMVEKKELHYGKALNWILENLRGFFYGLSHFSGAGLAKPLLLTFLSWLAMGLNFYIFTRIFAIPISYIHLLFLYPLVSLAQLLPVTVAGFGTRELALLYCFSHYGVPAQKTVAFSLLYFFIWFISMVIPGVIISFSAPFKERRES